MKPLVCRCVVGAILAGLAGYPVAGRPGLAAAQDGSNPREGAIGNERRQRGEEIRERQAGDSDDKESGEKKSSLQMSPSRFVTESVTGSLAEINLGRLAASKGESDSVKQFGERMVNDHTAALEKVRRVAQEKNIPVPSSPDSKHEKLAARLEKLSGTDFDKAYIQHMIRDHEKDVRTAERVSENSADADVKQLASTLLTTYRAHLERAREIGGELKIDAGSDHYDRAGDRDNDDGQGHRSKQARQTPEGRR